MVAGETNTANNTIVGPSIQVTYHPPDLAIAGMTAPAAADSGSTITLSATVSAAAGASQTFTSNTIFRLTRDGTLATNLGILCGGFPTPAPGSSVTLTCSAKIPATLATGTYYITASADWANEVPNESDETNNNSAPVPLQVTYRRPDFAVSGVTGPAIGSAGTAITVSATASELGRASQTFNSSVYMYLSLDGTFANRAALVCAPTPAFAPGTTQTLTCSGTLPSTLAAGAYSIGAVVDPFSYVAETDETNNVAIGNTILIGPDLIVSTFSGPTLAAAGSSINVAETVANRGAAAGAFTVGYYLSMDPTVTTSDVLLGTRAVSALASGTASSGTATLQLPSGISGTWYLAAIADSGRQVAEALETNNGSPVVAIDIASDTVPPAIAITGVTDGEVTNALPLSVCYTATDDFLMSDEGVLDGVSFRGCAVATSTGGHVLEVTATDFAGHVTSVHIGFTIDTSPPDITVTYPAAGTVVGTLVTVSAVASDVWGVAAVEANGSPLGAGQDGAYHGAITLHPSAPRVVVRATDLAGNVRSVTVPIILDTASPLALTIAAPSAAFVVDVPAVSVEGRITGGAPPITLRVNGITTSVAFDGTFATMAPAVPGAVEISVVASDAAGATQSATVSGTCIEPSSGSGSAGSGGNEGGLDVPSGVMRYLWDAAGNLTSVVDTSRDIGNCGQLGTRCPEIAGGATACNLGRCGAMLGGQFVDAWLDPSHCGASLAACAHPANGTAICTDGLCGVECYYGYVADGTACVDLLSDPNDCGRLGNVCEGAGAVCSNGRCLALGVPVVYDVNGATAPGVVLRASASTGIRVSGSALDNVTAVALEDWGPDGAGTDGTGLPSAPVFFTAVSGAEVAFRSSPTSLVIPGAALDYLSDPALSPGFQLREWYKLRLYYDDYGVPSEMLVDVAVSFDAGPAERPPPVISGVSALEVRVIRQWWGRGYDPLSGFLQLRDPDDCGVDPRLRPPMAVLAYGDPLETEYPVYSVTRTGVFLRAGLQSRYLYQTLGRGIGDGSPDSLVTLVFPYTNASEDFIDLGSADETTAIPPRCWTGDPVPQNGGIILRGANLFSDGALTVADPVGTRIPGELGAPVFLEDRVVIRPAPFYPSSTEPPLITGLQSSEGFVELSSPRGGAATQWPLRWIGDPEFDPIGAASFVRYDDVMTLTGRFFVRVSDVAFAWDEMEEHLRPAPATPPGPGQYFVVDEHHLQILLPAAGGIVPRELIAWCNGQTPVVERFPGTRRFEVTNAVATRSVTINALDPSRAPTWMPVEACPPPPPGNQPDPITDPVIHIPPLVPDPSPNQPRPPGDCGNTFCP